MARDLKEYRVFIASPSDLQEERGVFRDVVLEYNRRESGQRGVHFTAVGWEDLLPRMGRPQSIINEEIQTCDYFVLMLWNRWGTPPGDSVGTPYTSGTEEEFRIAKRFYDDPGHSLRDIAVFFKGVDPVRMSDPDLRMEQVLDFRKELESAHELLFHVFDETPGFERALRGLLGQWRRDHEDGKAAAARSRRPSPTMPPPSDEIAAPGPGSHNEKALLDAWRLAEMGSLTDAEKLFARSVVQGADPEAFRSYGAFLLRTGRKEQAEVMFDRILELTSDADRIWKAIAYGNLGLVRDLSGDMAGAEEMHRKSLAIHEELGRLDGMAQVQNSLGILSKRQGRMAEAEHLFRLALENGQAAGRTDIEARSCNNLGLLYRDQGKCMESEALFQRSLTLAEERAQGQEIATALVNSGILNLDRERLDVAEQMFSRAQSISRELGFREGLAQSSAGLAGLCLKQQNPTRARLLFDEALRIYTEMRRPEGVANAALNLGVVTANQGDLESAERLLVNAVDAYSELGEPFGQANAEENLGEVVRGRGEVERARQLWDQSRRRFEQLGLTSRAQQVTARLFALPPAK